MSEHKHRWAFYPESDDVILGLCLVAGCHQQQHIMLQETSYMTVQRHRFDALEQQLREAREENQRLQEANEYLNRRWQQGEREPLHEAIAEARQARALLERFAGMLNETFRDDGSLLGEGFNVSLIEQVQFCREVRAFLAT